MIDGEDTGTRPETGPMCYGEEDRHRAPPQASKPEDLNITKTFGIRNVRVQVAMIREDVWQKVMAYPFRSWREDFPKSLKSFTKLLREYWTECQVLLSSAIDVDGLPHDKRIELRIERRIVTRSFVQSKGSRLTLSAMR
jgi:hypothetical protein